MPDLQLDHIGLMVRDLERTAATLAKLFGYRIATMPVENSRQGVRGVFLVRPGGLTIKLVTPSDPTATGYQYGLHHLAFLVDDLDDAIQELRGSGARLIGQPQPGEMFDDELIAFMFGAGINFELVTTREWRSRIQLTDGDQATR